MNKAVKSRQGGSARWSKHTFFLLRQVTCSQIAVNGRRGQKKKTLRGWVCSITCTSITEDESCSLKNRVAAKDLCGRLEFRVAIVGRVQVAAGGPQPGFEAQPWHMLWTAWISAFFFPSFFPPTWPPVQRDCRRRRRSLPAYGAGICLFLSFFAVRQQ